VREILLATCIAGFVLLMQLGARLFVTPSWIGAGLAAIVLGLIISIPAAVLYHLRLYEALNKRDALDAGWIWHPTRFHDRLLADERPAVMIWFSIGAGGWGLTLLGCALVALAIWII
jgi:hypothetical protein